MVVHGAKNLLRIQVSRETSPAGSSYRTGFPFLTFAGFRLWRTTSRFVAFLGALSGSYWYAVFRSPLRPTSRDKTDSTHVKGWCQHGFWDLWGFLPNGVCRAMKGLFRAMKGTSDSVLVEAPVAFAHAGPGV